MPRSELYLLLCVSAERLAVCEVPVLRGILQLTHVVTPNLCAVSQAGLCLQSAHQLTLLQAAQGTAHTQQSVPYV